MENESQSTIRVAGIIIKDGKLLLVKGKGYEHLWTPGGKVDGNETDEECLRRELKEEIGVELVEAKFYKEYDGFSFYKPSQRLIQRIYITAIKSDIKPAMEIEDFIWLSKEDFYNKKYPMMPIHEGKIFIDLIKDKIW